MKLFAGLALIGILILASHDAGANTLPSYFSITGGFGTFTSYGDLIPKTQTSEVLIDASYHYMLNRHLSAVVEIEPSLTGDILSLAAGAQYFFLGANDNASIGIGDSTQIQVFHLWDPYVTILFGVDRFQLQFQKTDTVTGNLDTNIAVSNLMGPVFKAGTLYRIKDDLALILEIGGVVGIASGLTSNGIVINAGVGLFF